MNKRVVFIAPGIYPCVTGGMEIFYYFLIDALKERYDVTLFSRCGTFPGKGIRIVRCRTRLFLIKRFFFGRFSVMVSFVWSLIRGKIKSPCIIHLPYTSNSSYWGFALPVMARVMRFRYVVLVHGGAIREWKPRWAGRTLFSRADRIAAVSDEIRNEYIRRTGREVKTVIPMIPFEKAEIPREEMKRRMGCGPGDYIILFLGSLKPIKGCDVLLEAFLQLGLDYIRSRSLKLVFAGSGESERSLKEFCRIHRLSRDVRFSGLLEYSEVKHAYGASDLYVIPSRFEGTPKSLLGAMFNGLPVIGADVPGINNILQDHENALLFPRSDAGGLGRCIMELVSDRRLADRLGEKARETYSRRFSFSETVDSVCGIYESVFSGYSAKAEG